MIYAKVINGVIHDTAPRADYFPTTTFPVSGPSLEWLAAENLFEIQMRKPYNQASHKVVPCQPYIENGAVFGVEVVALSQDELDAIDNAARAQNEIQAKRMLEETDWSQLADVNLTNQADFTTYRAALRAILLNPPVTATWPTRPTAVWA